MPRRKKPRQTLGPGERCTVPIKSLHLEALVQALESKKYKKHTNYHPRYGTGESSLPTMLRTLLGQWSLGGVLTDLFVRYTGKGKWIKGWNGYIAEIGTERAQFLLPKIVVVWAFDLKDLYDVEYVQDFVFRYDDTLANMRGKSFPESAEIKWRFPRKD